MDKRSSKKKEHDFAVTAFKVVQKATKEAEEAQAQPEQADLTPDGKNPHAVVLGRLGGKKGGKARAAKLTPEQRRQIAKRAAEARWANKPGT